MFDDIFNHITTRSDMTNATVEIIIMLLGAFILGFILRHFLGCKSKLNVTHHHRTPEPTISSVPAAALDIESNTESKVKTKADKPPEDLKLVKGIDPKIEALLHAGGILTMAQLATVDTAVIQKILNSVGSKYARRDPQTWSIQADLIEDKKWIELEEYQDTLVGGKNP
ncbi:MAG: hypothetical protein COB23_01750 [Methylophaga sp.]|nr:MAG: hypothetical protein COB23_01750 [Methylophaga sp.]